MMSSSVTSSDDFVSGRKLLVHVAENGRSFEFECDGSTLVEIVQRSIETVCGIPGNDQLLLCLDKKLESNRPLSFYKLPQDESEVFIYNRPRLHADAPPPDPEIIEVPEIIEPDPPSSSRNPHPLDDAADPALRALPSYEREFRYHFLHGRALFTTSQAKFETCQRLLEEQKIQKRALETARGSMDQGYKVVQQNFTDFIKSYMQQHRYHSDILVNLGRDIEKLRYCELHPSLQTENRKCLLDLVKEDSLRKLAENCANSHRQFEIKVAQLKSMFGELKRRVGDLCLDKATAGIKDAELMIEDHHKYLNEQKSIMQSLSKDVSTVKKHVDDCLSSEMSKSLRPHDAISALGPMYHVHENNHLPKMQGCDHSVTKLLDACKVKKNEMNLFVHHFMQKVVYVQFSIRDIRLQFPAFKEAMEQQDDFFADLKILRGLAPAYRACFAEVIRRKSSMKLYMGLAGQLAERLASEREVEVRKREEFLKTQSVYIPRDILVSLGLFDSPKQCDIHVPPFDTNLIEIDFADLDHFAPKHLSGLPINWEKNSLPKESLTASAESYGLSETETSSAVINDKYDSDEIVGACGSINIAGTSKLEVENAWLKAELASAVALICSFSPDIGVESVDDNKLNDLLKNTAEKTAEALKLKDEYNNHIQSMLKMKEMQCSAYKARIQELEQSLTNNYLQGKKHTSNKDVSESDALALKTNSWKSGVFGDVSSELMDDASYTPAVAEPKLQHFTGSSYKHQEGVDENMTDLPGILSVPAVDATNNSMDSSMLETNREQKNDDKGREHRMTMGFGHSEKPDNLVSELRNTLSNKSTQCDEMEIKLKAAMEEVNSLMKELEVNRKLLDESLINCAHLENCLHEAREQAHTNLCAADRKVSEYNVLRTSAVKMHGLFERFRSCVTASGGVTTFVESLRSLAQSLASSATEDEDDAAAEFRASIRILTEKTSILARQRTELLDRSSKAEAAHAQIVKEVEEKKELVKSLYTKLQIEKQANKEKISLGRLEVHELAAFVLNSDGHYEAINRNFLNYYLSSESVALFAEQNTNRRAYVIGQVVHIERQVVKSQTASHAEHADRMISRNLPSPGSKLTSLSNPYNLPEGCEYFLVTVAMLPDTICSSAS